MDTTITAAISANRARRGGWSRLGTGISYAILTLGAVAVLLPFLWMLTSAFKPAEQVIAYPPVWIPAPPTLDNVVRAWTKINFARYFVNSMLVATTIMLAVITTSSLSGYVFAKFEFRGRDALFIAILAVMMVPWPITLIPRYQLMVWTGLLNTYGAVIFPDLFSAFGIFLMRQFMLTIPNELIDAGRIDGASEPRIFVQIVLPLARPALAALAILQFIWSWDSFIWPLLVLNKPEMFTLPLGLAAFTTEYYVDYPALMGGAIISVLPVFAIYVTLQRQFVAGIAMTGLKG
jgi:multiple sugar transport system permease protein